MPEQQGALVVVGLGNPGPRYYGTRHNVGFDAVDRLASDLGMPWNPGLGPWLEACGHRGRTDLVFVKPLTYMNCSGDATRALATRFAPEEMLVVCDDLDLPLGRIRLRLSGSAGGQKGLASIIDSLETDAVPRLRLGIGPKQGNASDFVLAPFQEDEIRDVEDMLDRARDAVLVLLDDGAAEAMNQFNRQEAAGPENP